MSQRKRCSCPPGISFRVSTRELSHQPGTATMLRWRIDASGATRRISPIIAAAGELCNVLLPKGLELPEIALAQRYNLDSRDEGTRRRLTVLLEGWMQPLAPLCLYYANRRHPSAAFAAFVRLARDYATGLRSKEA